MKRGSTLSLLVAAITLVFLLLSGCFGPARSKSSETGVAFATPQSFGVGSAPSAVGSADFDEDGRPDLIVANTGSNTISILMNATSAPTASPTAEVSPDASPTTTPTPSPSPSASPSPATVSFGDLTFDYAVPGGPRSIATGDIDGDGRTDIVTGNSDGTVSVLLSTSASGTTSPTFSRAFLFQASGRPQEETVEVADINGDGRQDVFAANALDGTVSILLNTTISNTIPTFNGPFAFSTGAAPQQVAVLDINGDGFLDVVTANQDGSVTVLLGSTVAMSAIPNPPPPTFSQTFSFPLSNGSAVSLVVADFNKDSQMDIAVATTSGNAAVLRNTTSSPSPSPTASPVEVASTVLSFASAQIFGLNGTPSWLTAGSFAVGGSNDLVSANTGNNNVSVLINQSAGETLDFQDAGRWDAGTAPSFVLPLDVDSDGKTDLVVTDRASNQISVLINVSTSPPDGVSSSPTATIGGSTTTSGTGTSGTGTASGTSGSTGAGVSF